MQKLDLLFRLVEASGTSTGRQVSGVAGLEVVGLVNGIVLRPRGAFGLETQKAFDGGQRGRAFPPVSEV